MEAQDEPNLDMSDTTTTTDNTSEVYPGSRHDFIHFRIPFFITMTFVQDEKTSA